MSDAKDTTTNEKKAATEEKKDKNTEQKTSETTAVGSHKETTAENEKEASTLEEVVAQEPKRAKKKKGELTPIAKDEIRPGMVIRVHQKIVDVNPKGEEKERTQVFQGMVISKKHGREPGSTITVRKVSGGIGVEKIFPLNMPSLEKFELVRTYRVRQAQPYYLRTYRKRLTEIK